MSSDPAGPSEGASTSNQSQSQGQPKSSGEAGPSGPASGATAGSAKKHRAKRGGKGGKRKKGSGGVGGAAGNSGSKSAAPEPGVQARRLALAALARIEEGAYANLLLGPMLDDSELDRRDKALVAELVYGTTRMRAALDFLIDRHVLEPPDASGRAALRLGAYQLHFMRVPSHAAVSATVAASPKRLRGFVNAVLRKLSAEEAPPWPNLATELSYPGWIVDLLTEELGPAHAEGALRWMNQAATVDTRDDGYTQNRASQWVAAEVGAEASDLVLDLCAAPGGKATAIAASSGARVVAADLNPSRVARMVDNIEHLGAKVETVVADATATPFAAGCADRVLIDAPCSGLGVLQRRPDARWRIEPAALDRLPELQYQLVAEAIRLCRPGGTIIYSVCTLSRQETTDVARRVSDAHPELIELAPPGSPWEPVEGGARLLPQVAEADGMALFRWQLAR